MALPPGPRGQLRALLAFDRDPIGSLARWHAEFGETFGIRAGRQWIVSVKRAEDVAEVLLDRQRIFPKDRFTRELSFLLGDGLLTSDGDHWRAHRKLVAPTLRRSHIKHYADIFVGHTRRWLAGVEGEVDLHQQMMELTLGIVAEALFATESVRDVDRIEDIVEQAMAAHIKLERGWQRILPGWLPGTPRWVIGRAAATLAGLVQGLIDDRRRRPPGDDLLWRMIEARDDTGAGMHAAGLRAESATLFMAGHETTALALTYAMYHLGRSPAAMDRLRAEVQRFEGPLTADDVSALPYAAAVIDEAMRLHPPAWLIGREATQAVTLGGYDLPAGTTVVVPIITMHHDPVRFADPTAFRPERWLEGPRPGRWDYLPFGGGARVCVGNHFALMEAVLVLATMIQGARFEVLQRSRPKTLPSITLRPVGGLPVRITKDRSPGAA